LSQIREIELGVRSPMGIFQKTLETLGFVFHDGANEVTVFMPQVERIRENLEGPLTDEEIRRKAQSGWKPVAVVWERELDSAHEAYTREVDVPYGYKVAPDAVHLEVNDQENAVLMLTMELIVQDQRLSHIAAKLNEKGFRTRNGFIWNPASVFELLPRLIESGPRIFTSEEWIERRKRLGQLLTH
jgi:hypothetical protein